MYKTIEIKHVPSFYRKNYILRRLTDKLKGLSNSRNTSSHISPQRNAKGVESMAKNDEGVWSSIMQHYKGVGCKISFQKKSYIIFEWAFILSLPCPVVSESQFCCSKIKFWYVHPYLC